jgi:S-(hydroxymethyl)glutathione dehydrogenase/alcohol dehydrogenase
MKAAVFHAPNQPLTIEDVDIAKPGRREVLIRTAATGLCHSDLHFIEGKYPGPVPAVLGHECSGIVEQVGEDVSYVKPGDAVITCLSVFCGHCESCVTGRMAICQTPEIRTPPGPSKRLSWRGRPLNQILNLSGFAEQMLVHEHALVRIPKEVPMDRAALIGCAVITGYGAVVHTTKLAAGETIAVLGCGGIGRSAINAAQIAGASRIVAVDTDATKLAMARTFGATDTVDATAGDAVQAVLALTGGGVHHALECVGLKQTAEQAFGMLRAGGTATIVGMIPFGTKIELHGFDFLRERRIQGSLMGSNRFPVDMPRLVDFYMSGKLKLDQMISQRIRLDQVNEGFDDMKKGGLARSVIVFD